jgi:prepilin-type N-terminal cleavage/methylation domain-containing protein
MTENCSTIRKYRSTQGFTLVELLVVISIISILAGALFMVINPAKMQTKAKEAVLRAKTAQICSGLYACSAAKDDATLCDAWISGVGRDWTELGITLNPDGDPPTSIYVTTATNPNVTGPTSTVHVTGSLTTGGVLCSYTCSFDFSNGNVEKLVESVGSSCL